LGQSAGECQGDTGGTGDWAMVGQRVKTLQQSGKAGGESCGTAGSDTGKPATARSKVFTLIETLVAMGVLGLTVGAVYTAITFGFSSMRASRENLRATQIMIEKVELIRLLSWGQVVTNNILPATFVAYYDPAGSTNGKGGGAKYTGTIEVMPFASVKNYQPEMREVIVRVDWVTGGLKHSRKLKTQIAHYGLQNYVYN
jgi:hypothetical protein